MKTFLVDKEDSVNVVDWLKNNFGTEGVRWWRQDNTSGLSSLGISYYSKTKIWVDCTEDEESLLTFFILKFDQ